MKIAVQPDSWGHALPQDIATLLTDTASHINRMLSGPVTDHVHVIPAPETDWTPRTHYRHAPNAPICIQLTARNRRWAQFAYQFAHEFCHIASDYQRLANNPNNWFHEALCELASVFTLRKMAGTWPTQPPYPHWADYAGSLASYANDLLSDQQHQLPSNQTLAAWLSNHEEELRDDPYLREKNAVVAYTLLPIFEDQPEGWNTIRELPNSAGTLAEYLAAWHERVDAEDKPFVKRLMGAFL